MGIRPLQDRILVSASRRKGPVFRRKKGDRILFSKYAGTEVKIDGEEHLIIREEEVLGVIEE